MTAECKLTLSPMTLDHADPKAKADPEKKPMR